MNIINNPPSLHTLTLGKQNILSGYNTMQHILFFAFSNKVTRLSGRTPWQNVIFLAVSEDKRLKFFVNIPWTKLQVYNLLCLSVCYS